MKKRVNSLRGKFFKKERPFSYINNRFHQEITLCLRFENYSSVLFTFLVAERLTDAVRILDHDPSLALYRLQGIICEKFLRHHFFGSYHARIQSTLAEVYLVYTVESIRASSSTFEDCSEMLRNCIFYKQQLDFDAKRKLSDVTVKGRSKSLHDVTYQPDEN
ncbi:unnamed protein product [Nippostrongylus brasiliensis]|uniref:Protein MEF2BNB homolog (inferred by orthology to a C. elegans protein) n=1 Tax=Nippostrongylus brasiliensis TaxID=27835 RepID=A0A0N4Y8U0_NIPBR|nr:unnamed protein product [Nippostrongylus brasiliensis]